jgi:cytoskeletal protein CcmA (bactofilin family)
MRSEEKQMHTNRQIADTRIDFETTLHGKIEFNGLFYLDGVIEGDLNGKEFEKTTAIIAMRGKVSGNVHCTNAVIAGTIWGDIYANSIELHAGARVFGDLYYDSLEINPMAEVNGKFILLNEAERSSDPYAKISLEAAVSAMQPIGKSA